MGLVIFIIIAILLPYLIKAYLSRRSNKLGNRSIIKAQTEDILQIVPYSIKPQKSVALPEICINKPEGLIELAWSLGGRKTFHVSDIKAVEINREGSDSYWTLEGRHRDLPVYHPEYIFYSINLGINDGSKILIAKERDRGSAESLVQTITKYLDLEITRGNHVY